MSPVRTRRAADRADGDQRLRRRRAWRRGLWAEFVCVAALRLRGYRVLERRLRCPVGEIDIVARRGDTLAIVEVKARDDLAAAMEAVSPRQQRRILRATAWLLGRRPELAELVIRFDVMLVVPWHRPRHLRDAWQADMR